MFQTVIFTTILPLILSAPMGPPSDPLIPMKAEDILDSGFQQGKLASDSFHQGLMAAHDLQAKQLALTSAQMQDLTSNGIQQHQQMSEVVKKQLVNSLLQQQQLAMATLDAEKMAVEAVHKQVLSGLNFQKKLFQAVVQAPQVVMDILSHPLNAIQSLTGMTGGLTGAAFPQAAPPMSALSALTGAMTGGGISALSPSGGLLPLMARMDQALATTAGYLSPLLSLINKGLNTASTATQSLSAG